MGQTIQEKIYNYEPVSNFRVQRIIERRQERKDAELKSNQLRTATTASTYWNHRQNDRDAERHDEESMRNGCDRDPCGMRHLGENRVDR